jgi:hypothetical protein
MRDLAKGIKNMFQVYKTKQRLKRIIQRNVGSEYSMK